MASNTTQAVASGDLVDLVSSSGAATIYPSDDAILAVLQARFRADLPYTRIGATNLVVVNPYKTLANVNDISAKDYEERSYKDTSLPMVDSAKPLQPHLYDLAARVYLLMRRRNESQAVLARGITGSGKSSSLRLFVNQVLRLSTHSRKEAKVAEQIKAVNVVLDSFGNAKTLMNPNASRHGRYLELHFNERGRISSSKILTYGLDKSRLNRLTHEERSYHVFYQLIAGATTTERDHFNLEDPSDYALLASSGTYRLPSGPFSDDSIGMSELRAAMRILGFKQKHMASIFSILVAILLLGNLQFQNGDAHDVSAYIHNTHVLDHVARLLGTTPDDLSQVLTNKTSYVRKELYTVLLNAEQSSAQRDQCVRDLYSILFAFVVETANHRLAPSAKDPPPHSQIVTLDQPGFQTRGPAGTSSMSLTGTTPLVSVYGQNTIHEFCINFCDELLQSYVLRNTFEDTVGYNAAMASDGIALPSVATMDNGACIELLRGVPLSERSQRKPGGLLGILNKSCSSYKSGKGGDHRDEDMLQELVSKFGVHASFVTNPGSAADRTLFGINHYSGPVSYDITGFVEKDSDLLDSAFVSLLRNSADPFVSKLLSGPSLAAERHYKDENTIVQAQVSSRPLRQPTPIPSPTGELPEEHQRLDPGKTYPVTAQLNFTLSEIFASLDRTRLWNLACIRPNDSGSPNSFDKRRVKAQIRALLLPDVAARRSAEYVADYEIATFCERYVPTMRGSEEERITQCARANGWLEGADFARGGGRIWLSYSAWKMVEDTVRAVEKEQKRSRDDEDDEGSVMPDDGTEYTHGDNGGLAPGQQSGYFNESADNLLTGADGSPFQDRSGEYGAGGLNTPGAGARGFDGSPGGWDEDDKKGGAPPYSPVGKTEEVVVKDSTNAVEQVPTSKARRRWLWLVWGCTWWVPNWFMTHLGRMKRPDIRIAWREKLTICLLILLLNGVVIFYIVEFGRLLCPNFDKAWALNEVAQHQGQDDYWVTIQGTVYDVSNFVLGQHSDIVGQPSNGADTLETLAGQDLTEYFPVPLTLGCPDLVTDNTMVLTVKNTTITQPQAKHVSGAMQGVSRALHADNWYTSTFLTTMKDYRKGPLVYEKKTIAAEAADTGTAKIWAIWDNSLYDLTDYFHTQTMNPSSTSTSQFLNSDITDLFSQRSGQDITKPLTTILAALPEQTRMQNVACLKNVFKIGEVDFRKTARCQVQNYMLIVVSAILMGSVALKFLAALQFGSKRSPETQDKFVLCQVPCYTEGEDSLRRTIDSLAALNYDDKRKLIFIICDGNIIGSGNDRTTPRIVLDILGIDPKLDPEPLLFKSVGEGSKALNYGKVYSGLYEFEGHVVPYMVVVKVGKPTERSKPGNRGKRDSQILLLHYLNRVHFDAPMSPLELEIYHQMRNVIGIDPAFYEYIFTIDADTTVTPDALNRLVATSADDQSIIGVCGETKLQNEEGSWWTMIQVYEYYISHHLSKAFESLFGSVTCLPGCFTLYRIRTADKGRPIIISNRIIDEYAEPNVDTLHKKNLFSLGEDRFLTTLLMKHFPTFKTKFCPDALAHTVAPESWRILFSQRRRWINSTVHNLCELVLLPELFGFCCFSMRFFVFIDLVGTLILPATVVYLVYLIIVVSTGNAALPTIAIAMIAVTYGLQAIIFILKREFMLCGWMVVYILSYPVYSFFLPVYSFWCMDEFGWGNTRLVIGEGKDKKVIINEDEKFDDSMIPLKKFSEYEAEAWETGTRHSDDTGYNSKPQSRRPPRSREESPHTYQEASQSGDYYRDTNLTFNNSSNPNLRLGGSQHSHSNVSHHQPMGPQYGVPQLPFMPFGNGPGSAAGSDYGHMPMVMPQLSYQNTGSMYGMMGPGMAMNPMMSGMFGGSMNGSQSGFAPPSAPGLQQRPVSNFSLATTANPFAGPSTSTNPSDDELFSALRNYLSTQDLMTVTKKTAREAIMARFPKADLSSRKDFLNQSIDTILSES
ncbi:glycosyltransferase family 2 protein [Lyophyllum atratum]|nr:glycosyltransferase family 2 protein [Lyophyllum atratum]